MRMKMNSWPRVLTVLLMLPLLSACSSSPKSIVKKRQADLKDKLAMMDMVCKQVEAACKEKQVLDKIALPAGAPPLEIDDIDIGLLCYKGHLNAQLFSASELWSPPDSKEFNANMFSARHAVLLPVKLMLESGKFPKNKKEAIKDLEGFLKWRYLTVFITRSIKAPQAGGLTGGSDSQLNSSFTGGAIAGDVLLYDMQDGACLGGFSVQSQNSENINGKVYGGEDIAAVMQRQLNTDLMRQVRKAIGDGFRSRCPVKSIANCT